MNTKGVKCAFNGLSLKANIQDTHVYSLHVRFTYNFPGDKAELLLLRFVYIFISHLKLLFELCAILNIFLIGLVLLQE